LRRPVDRQAVFFPEFRQDLAFWVKADRSVRADRSAALRILDLVEAVMRDPFVGIGKPEHLRHVLSGVWSRRITEEHRLLYIVLESRTEFLQARYHY
jgi:toxin YoeB